VGSLSAPKPALAQVLQGSLVGNVKDPSDFAIPEAKVTITNTQTGQSRTAMTDYAGVYRFPTMGAGTYDVNVTRDGFRPFTKRNVVVSINTLN